MLKSIRNQRKKFSEYCEKKEREFQSFTSKSEDTWTEHKDKPVNEQTARDFSSSMQDHLKVLLGKPTSSKGPLTEADFAKEGNSPFAPSQQPGASVYSPPYGYDAPATTCPPNQQYPSQPDASQWSQNPPAALPQGYANMPYEDPNTTWSHSGSNQHEANFPSDGNQPRQGMGGPVPMNAYPGTPSSPGPSSSLAPDTLAPASTGATPTAYDTVLCEPKPWTTQDPGPGYNSPWSQNDYPASHQSCVAPIDEHASIKSTKPRDDAASEDGSFKSADDGTTSPTKADSSSTVGSTGRINWATVRGNNLPPL